MFCIVIAYEQIGLTLEQKGALQSQANHQPFTHKIYASKADNWVLNYEMGAGLHATQVHWLTSYLFFEVMYLINSVFNNPEKPSMKCLLIPLFTLLR